MKKHEACHHLHLIREDVQTSLAYCDQRIREMKANASASDKEKADYIQFQLRHREEAELKLKAIDMAGDALTRGR